MARSEDQIKQDIKEWMEIEADKMTARFHRDIRELMLDTIKKFVAINLEAKQAIKDKKIITEN